MSTSMPASPVTTSKRVVARQQPAIKKAKKKRSRADELRAHEASRRKVGRRLRRRRLVGYRSGPLRHHVRLGNGSVSGALR